MGQETGALLSVRGVTVRYPYQAGNVLFEGRSSASR